jgi:hypothetical protein
MAKITHKGSWVEIKSLNKTDKKNYLTSLSAFFIGAVFWGVHITTIDGILGPEIVKDPTSSFYSAVRLLIVIFWAIAVYFGIKFLKAQDEFFHRYYYYIGAWGGLGFVFFGMLMSIFAPYIGFKVGFYECFLAYAIGTGIGGYLFDKHYIKDEE